MGLVRGAIPPRMGNLQVPMESMEIMDMWEKAPNFFF